MYVCTNIERQDTSRYNNSEWFRTLNTQIGGSKHLLPGPTTNLSDCHQWIRRRLSLSKCLAGIAVPGHGEGWNASECNYSKRSKSIAYMGPMGTYFTERLTALDHDYEFMNILHEFKSGNVHQICVLVQSVQQKKKHSELWTHPSIAPLPGSHWNILEPHPASLWKFGAELGDSTWIHLKVSSVSVLDFETKSWWFDGNFLWEVVISGPGLRFLGPWWWCSRLPQCVQGEMRQLKRPESRESWEFEVPICTKRHPNDIQTTSKWHPMTNDTNAVAPVSFIGNLPVSWQISLSNPATPSATHV